MHSATASVPPSPSHPQAAAAAAAAAIGGGCRGSNGRRRYLRIVLPHPCRACWRHGRRSRSAGAKLAIAAPAVRSQEGPIGLGELLPISTTDGRWVAAYGAEQGSPSNHARVPLPIESRGSSWCGTAVNRHRLLRTQGLLHFDATGCRYLRICRQQPHAFVVCRS